MPSLNGNGAESSTSNTWGSSRSRAGSNRISSNLSTQGDDAQGGDDVVGASASKKNRTRRGGGFLLQKMFHSSPKGSPNSDKGKGKNRPLSMGTPSSKLQKSREGSDAPLPVDIPKEGAISSASRNSWSYNEDRTSSKGDGGSQTRDEQEEEPYHGASPPSAIDPAQIVNMALNLSESRRRNFSGGPLASINSPSGRRVTSMSMGSPINIQQQPPISSLKQHLQQQRRISGNVSPGSNWRPVSTKPSSAPFGYGSYLDMAELGDSIYTPQIQFSASTMARAVKVKQQIELSVEYRRLLEYLQPLGARDEDGASRRREPQLGRQYNPLQLIRNRKLRARMRTPLNPEANQWEDTEEVRDWVNSVEDKASRPYYQEQDRVGLPKYPLNRPSSHTGKHQPSDTTIKPKRLRLDWYTSPQEMLADAYWLEQESNKYGIEDSRDCPMYQVKSNTESYKGRPSYESRPSLNEPSRHSIDSGPYDDSEHDDGRRPTRKRHLIGIGRHNNDESAGRLKHVLRRARGRSKSPSSDISLSDDDSAGILSSRKLPSSNINDANVGPLERHMDKMLAKESLDLSRSPTSQSSIASPVNNGRARLTEDQIMASIAMQAKPLSPIMGGIRSQRAKPLILDDNDNGSSAHNSPTTEKFFSPRDGRFSNSSSRNGSPTPRISRRRLPETILNYTPSNTDGEPYLQENEKGDRNNNQPSIDQPLSTKPRHRFSHKHSESITSLLNRTSSSQVNDAKDNSKEHESGVRRLLKGGRIAEIVRHEGARVGELIHVRRRDTTQVDGAEQDSDGSSKFMAESDTDTDRSQPVGRPTIVPHLERRPTASSAATMAMPTRPGKPIYHLDLPSFQPTHHRRNLPKTTTREKTSTRPDQNVKGANDSTPTSPSDLVRFSTHSSFTPSISRVSTMYGVDSSFWHHNSSRKSNNNDTKGSIAQQQPLRKIRFHHIRSGSKTNQRLQALLDIPGQAYGHKDSGLPRTGLTTVQALPNDGKKPSQPAKDQRHWSITDRQLAAMSSKVRNASVDRRDMARIKALLLCSGVKAAELARRANIPPVRGPSNFLVMAANTAHVSPGVVSKNDEYIVAAQLLSSSLGHDLDALQQLGHTFRDRRVKALHTRLDGVRIKAGTQVEHSRDMTDQAAAFGAQLAGQGTIDARLVMDSVLLLRRTRRRRLRWVRRAGFGLLEWSVLLILWCLWLAVVVVRGSWTMLKIMIYVVRWVLWID